MSKAEHRMPFRSRRTAIAATLAHSRRVKGSGAPAFRALLLVLVLALCALGVGVATATAEAPVVTAPQVSEVSYNTAHVKAELDPKGEGTNWFFEVSTDGTSWDRTNVEGEASGSGLQPIGGDITNLNFGPDGLRPGTTYQVRLHASNGSGTVLSPEPNPEFTTLSLPAPTVTIDPVTTFTGTTAIFTGTIDPNEPGGEPPAAQVNWHFECTPACPDVDIASSLTANPTPADSTVHAVSGEATGLEPNTTYEVTLVGKNAGDPVSDGPAEFTTGDVPPSAQTIPAFVLGGGTSALLGARINPHNSDTKYWFELEGPGGTEPLPSSKDASAGNGSSGQFVTQKALGLAPGTTYHFRVVAQSDGGSTVGESVPFTTPTSAPAGGECANKEFRVGPSASLPECRAFELSSLPDLSGYSARPPVVYAVGENLTPGNAMSAVAQDGNAVIWATDGILPGNDSDAYFDSYVSRRTDQGWKSEFISPPASKVGSLPYLTYSDPNLNRFVWRTGSQTLDPTDPDIGLDPEPHSDTDFSDYQDLMRREPNGEFVRLTKGPDESAPSPGETDSLSGTVTFSTDAIHGGFSWSGPELVAGDEGPGGNYVGNGETTTRLPAKAGPFFRSTVTALSDDGRTAVISTPPGPPIPYIKIVTDDLSQVIDVAEGPGQDVPVVERLTPDGQTLFYRSLEQETGDDTDNSVDLYEFNVATESNHRVSAPTGNPAAPGPGNRSSCPAAWNGSCDSLWVATSKDGAYLYFVSPEILDGDLGVAGGPNLYLRTGSQTTYVATLDPSDDDFGGHRFAHRRVQFTADQSKLLFQSRARITAYDNQGFNEIYRYEPSSGEIVCASCRLDGSQPQGETLLRMAEDPQFEGRRMPGLPLSVPASDASGQHVYFATFDSLRPGDADTNSDVYSADLQHGTISSVGNLPEDGDNFFWGAAANGRDLFILSSSRLSDEDRSIGAFKVYDARIGGGFPPPPTKPAETCDGDNCHGPRSAEPEPLGSATSRIQGPGDPPIKRKRPAKKQHGKHKHKHGHGKHKHGKGNKHTRKHKAGDQGRYYR